LIALCKTRTHRTGKKKHIDQSQADKPKTKKTNQKQIRASTHQTKTRNTHQCALTSAHINAQKRNLRFVNFRGFGEVQGDKQTSKQGIAEKEPKKQRVSENHDSFVNSSFLGVVCGWSCFFLVVLRFAFVLFF
jgi:hypothetical protein